MIAESHISLHGVGRRAFVDVFSCRPFQVEAVEGAPGRAPALQRMGAEANHEGDMTEESQRATFHMFIGIVMENTDPEARSGIDLELAREAFDFGYQAGLAAQSARPKAKRVRRGPKREWPRCSACGEKVNSKAHRQHKREEKEAAMSTDGASRAPPAPVGAGPSESS